MQTVKEFCQTNGVSAISNVRSNANGLKYCTFIINGTAENIYFSKRATDKVALDDKAKAIKDMFITLVEYDDAREARYKIATGGDEFTQVADMF